MIASQLHMREIYHFVRLAWTCGSVWPPIASYGFQTCVDLRRRTSPLSQLGFRHIHSLTLTHSHSLTHSLTHSQSLRSLSLVSSSSSSSSLFLLLLLKTGKHGHALSVSSVISRVTGSRKRDMHYRFDVCWQSKVSFQNDVTTARYLKQI